MYINSKVNQSEKINKSEDNLKFVLNQIFEPDDELIKLYNNDVKNSITASVWNSNIAFQIKIVEIYKPYFGDIAFQSFCSNNIFMIYFDVLNDGNKMMLQKIIVVQNKEQLDEYNFKIYLSYKKSGESMQKIIVNGIAVLDENNIIKNLKFNNTEKLMNTSLYRIITE
jgi:hypothetical protein